MTVCGCVRRCGDDGDIDGPGTCKGLPLPPQPPPVEVVLLLRAEAARLEARIAACHEEVACPRCGMRKGHRCVGLVHGRRAGNRELKKPHRERWALVVPPR
jgi:hypothetical protein